MLRKINKFFIKHTLKVGRLRRLLLIIFYFGYIYLIPFLPISNVQNIGIMIGILILTLSFTKFK